MPERKPPVLAIIVPCFNEQEVLPITIPILRDKLHNLIQLHFCDADSFIVYVDDGSRDGTWEILSSGAREPQSEIRAIRLALNSGHQNALLAGLEYATGRADATISIDADLQDDLSAMEPMLRQYISGQEIVLGVRNDRSSDSAFKRWTAGIFYKLMQAMGVDALPQHADYRLLSDAAMRNLARFHEYHVYLRGYPRLLHSRISTVTYRRNKRLAGETKYSLQKMITLAWNGITSFSVVPLRIIGILGGTVFLFATALSIFAIIAKIGGDVVPGWASVTAPLYALGGMIMLSIGVVGEYVGKIYMEVKRRPRYLVDKVEAADE